MTTRATARWRWTRWSWTRWWWTSALVAFALVAAACGDDGGAGPGDGTAAAEPVDYSARGPYAVGQVDLALDDEHLVSVMYPVDPDTVTDDAEPYRYSGDTIFGPEISGLLPGALSGEFGPDDTWVGLPASSDGPYPVVLHSHGAAGNLRFGSNHNSHVASWGYVVAAVDHPERGVVAVLESTLSGGSDTDEAPDADPNLDTDQLLAGLDLVIDEAGNDGSPLAGAVDGDKVAAEGHSAGGSASGAAAFDPRVDLWIGQAPGPPIDPDVELDDYTTPDTDEDEDDRPQFDRDAYRAENPPPPVESLVIPAEGDEIVELEGVEAAFEWLDQPKRLAVIAESGHAVYVDPCEPIQAEGGLTDFVESLGVDPEAVPLVRLGEDGCAPEDTPAATVWEVIDHLTVGQLNLTFDRDADAARASLERDYLDATFPDLLAAYTVVD